jgi:thiamine-phosphate pyrophosphorylase
MRCLLYYITERSQFGGGESARREALLARIAEAACAGVDYIQIREKDLSGRELETLVEAAVRVVRNSSASRLLINSRTDVALAAGADGVHLRAEDISVRDVRGIAEKSAKRLVVGASCHNVAQVMHSEDADLVVFGPVFGKRGAAGAQPAGLNRLREACHWKVPVLALGGVTVENARSCLEAGAAGVAGIRLFQENRIADVVRALRTT